MSAGGGIVLALVDGAALGLRFNPATALAGAVAASVIAGYPSAPESRRPLAVGVLALAWLAGDGARIGRVIGDGAGGPAMAAALAAWVVASAIVGYVIPAAAGIGVGRRVVKGTGWLSAGAVSFAVAGALSVVSPAVAAGIRRMAGLG